MRNRNARRAWFNRAATEAGVPTLTPHELRHTAASLAVSAGANVLALSRMLGHANPSVTLDIYADLFDDDLEAIADSLDRLRRDSIVTQMRPKRSKRRAPERDRDDEVPGIRGL
jgi:integrase